MNYNISKPKLPPKKYFNYQNLFFITFVLGLIFIFSRVFVQDAVYYRMLAEDRLLTEPNFTYSAFIKFLGNNSVSLFLDLLGRISLPLSIFCVFICFKNNKLNILLVTLICIFMEVFFDYFHYGMINLKNNSEYVMIILSIGFFYLWESVKRIKYRWLYRLLMAVALVVIPVFFNIRSSLLYSIFIISITFFDPVRLNQAVFGAISMFAHGSTMLASVFIYFYDEDFNKKKSNAYFLLLIPLFTILIFILRNIILG